CRARTLERVLHAVVALVARVLEEWTVGVKHRKLCAPRLRPRLRVFDSELVQDPVRGDAREAFDDVQRVAGSLDRDLVVEVRRVDDERVAFPSPARIAAKLANLVRNMR